MNGVLVKISVLISLFAIFLLAGCWRPPSVQIYTSTSEFENTESFARSDATLQDRGYDPVYVVKKGDTAYEIARCHGVELKAFVVINKMFAPYLIKIGQRVRLPAPTKPPSCVPNTRDLANQSNGHSSDSLIHDPSVNLIVSPPAIAVHQVLPISEPPLRAGDKFLWPVSGKLISEFGPKPGNLRNDGINISAPAGSPVRAAENGVVAYAGNELRGYGNMLLVRHDGGWVTAYAHNSKLLVELGAVVARGEVIARVGESGNVDRPQTHFELRRGDKAVDPRAYLSWK